MDAFLKTNASLIFKFTGLPTKTVPITDSIRCKKLLDLIKNKATDAELLAAIDTGLHITMHKSGLFGIENGNVFILGDKLPKSMGDRVIEFAEAGLPLEPLIKFWNNCQANPDPTAKSDLYAFLEQNGHPITSDGCFIAYRYVTKDKDGSLWDAHTHTMRNDVGRKVSMERSLCCPDRNKTCEAGLHVAAEEFVRGHRGGGSVVVEVKVNPKNVVAIPTDYNGQKMRCCEFDVLALNEGLIDKLVYDEENLDLDEENLDLDEDDLDDEEEYADERGAVSTEIDFSQPVDDGVRVNPSDNWKTQKRGPGGRFLPKGS